jgi:hypothetical protein
MPFTWPLDVYCHPTMLGTIGFLDGFGFSATVIGLLEGYLAIQNGMSFSLSRYGFKKVL